MKPTIAWKLVPSNAPGKVNVKDATGAHGNQNLSIDPLGNIGWSNNDGNYEQFTRNGLAIEVAPGSDTNPNAPTFVLFPE